MGSHASLRRKFMNLQMFDLSERTALITGGNGGIGLGMARGLAAAGARIVLLGRNVEKGEAAKRALVAEGAEAHFISADITKEEFCIAATREAADHFGNVDILINNAGIAIRKTPQDYSFEEWRQVLDSNLSSAFLMARAVYPHMRDAGGGKIINIASILALFGAPFSVAYSASKGGLVQFTKALATAWAADNIQVNAILPGWIDTELTVSARAQVDGLNDLVMSRTPAKRWGRTEDFAGAAIYLASPASNFVTGASLLVDGGYSAQA
jgi:2-deoxy-D-gluconate 3-dehydrogenase